MSEVVSFEDYSCSARTARGGRPGRVTTVFFDRRELQQIFDLYAAMVAAGEWRDYAISYDTDGCCFAAFRRASEIPLFRIVKAAASKQTARAGAYSVIAANGEILKRTRDLASALRAVPWTRLKLV